MREVSLLLLPKLQGLIKPCFLFPEYDEDHCQFWGGIFVRCWVFSGYIHTSQVVQFFGFLLSSAEIHYHGLPRKICRVWILFSCPVIYIRFILFSNSELPVRMELL